MVHARPHDLLQITASAGHDEPPLICNPFSQLKNRNPFDALDVFGSINLDTTGHDPWREEMAREILIMEHTGGYNILYKTVLVWFIFIYIFLFIHPFVSHYCWLYPHYIPINSHEMTHKWPTHFGPTWRPGGPWRLRFWPSRGASRAPVWAKSAGAAENRRGARTSCWGCWGWAPAHLRQVSWDFDLETDTRKIF